MGVKGKGDSGARGQAGSKGRPDASAGTPKDDGPRGPGAMAAFRKKRGARGVSATHHPPHADVAEWKFPPIGYVRSPFKEKFGIPRQPGLAAADAVLKLNPDPLLRNAVRELEGFSHLWVVFVFHAHDARSWKPSVRPPRLGGARKVGVLASRSPHRPNPIGLSAVRLRGIDLDAPGGVEIRLGDVDLLDGTPVLDIKPYLPYADSIPDAAPGWAGEAIARVPVEFTERAEAAIAALAGREARGSGGAEGQVSAAGRLKELITQLLELDPRPAFQKRRMPPGSGAAQGTRYGFRLLEYDVKWEIRDGIFRVLDVVELE
jgi:tRNA-Thr(GGU) m(6)t(6)A37 methyltransferase TsaA